MQNVSQKLPASSHASWIPHCAQVIRRIRPSYWLLICGSFLIVGSVLLTWVRFPYSFNVAGWELPVQAVVPHIHEFSYGLIGVAVLVVAFCLRKRFRRSMLLGAAILLLDWMLVPARITFHQAPLLRRLSEENQAVQVINAFTRRTLPPNLISMDQIVKPLDLISLSGRFAASVSVLALGWYCFGLGSLLVACYAVIRQPGERLASSLVIILLPLGVLILLAVPSTIGQYYFHRASVARAGGTYEHAIANYRKAMRWGNWYTNGIEVYNIIGQLEMQTGVHEGSAERAISRAVDFHAKGQYEQAILEFQRAEETKPALSKTVRHEAERTRADWGLACYQSGAIEAAVANWQKALDEDSKGRPLKSQPSLLYVLPYLARGNYELGRYEAGIKAATEWAEVTADHKFLQTDAHSIAADCYAKLSRDAEAGGY